MKIYLMETNAGNEILFEENGVVKVNNYAPHGYVDGVVDLYTQNVIEELKQYFNNTIINDFAEIYGETYPKSNIDGYSKLTLVYSDENESEV